MFGLARTKLALIAVAVGVAAFAAYTAYVRHDAVSDAKQDAKIEATEGSRKIENEIRSLDDDALIDCLSGRGC